MGGYDFLDCRFVSCACIVLYDVDVVFHEGVYCSVCVVLCPFWSFGLVQDFLSCLVVLVLVVFLDFSVFGELFNHVHGFVHYIGFLEGEYLKRTHDGRCV